MRTVQPTPLLPGSAAPDFTLTDVVTGVPVTLSAVIGRGVVLNFWSVECPWTRYYDDYFVERAAVWGKFGVSLIMINSNANESREEMHDMADAYGMGGPILHDIGSVVADAYGAITTPHIFVIHPEGLIIYQGAIDDRSFRQPEPTVNYLDLAVEALLAGESPAIAETPAYGCTIVRSM
jgi:peroxiredoxin